jgi:hypothetical protein
MPYKGTKKKSGISYRHVLFATEFMNNQFNAFKAYEKVFPNAVYNNGHRVLKRRDVREYIEERLEARKITPELLQTTADRVALELINDPAVDPNVKAKILETLNKYGQRIDKVLNPDAKPVEQATVNITFSTAKKPEKDA